MATRGVSQTQAVHAGEPRPNGTRSVVPPLVASTSYPIHWFVWSTPVS